MKRSRETYKLGRKLMDSIRVPMTSNSSGVPVNLHYKKDMSSNYPVKRADGTYTNGVRNIKAGQLRMRRPKTANEVHYYYGPVLSEAVSAVEDSLEKSGFDTPISYSYSVSSASSASTDISSAHNKHSNDANSSNMNNAKQK